MQQWKIINGYTNYMISNYGEVMSTRFNRLLKPSSNDSGYLYVNLINEGIVKTTAVHKLVMEHYGLNSPGANWIIDHIDENKHNNQISNLQWITIQKNTEKYYNNTEKKKSIIELHKEGKTTKEIVLESGLSTSTVRQTILRWEALQKISEACKPKVVMNKDGKLEFELKSFD